jgi:phosphatidylinositol alpha-1,6-mannosyltransferase
MPARPLVQFVSKPIAAPFRDGTKCFVRDLVTHFSEVDSAVMGTREGAAELLGLTRIEAIYGDAGRFAPGLSQNLRAASWLLFQSRADIWHYVFAPNLRSSQVGRALRALRRIPVVQTIASPPRSFTDPHKLLFGDVIVAQSDWTRAQFLSNWQGPKAPTIHVVPPPAPLVPQPSEQALTQVRARLGATAATPIFLYPGDLEISQGAARVGALIEPIRALLPEAVLVFAYRDKSSAAEAHARELQAQLPQSGVHFEKNVPDIHALVAASSAILFPVDDLYGKIDLPIVLLEAMGLGTPVLALDEGPLTSLTGAWRAPFEPAAWAERAVATAKEGEIRGQAVALGRAAARDHYAPGRVARAYEAFYRQLLAGR